MWAYDPPLLEVNGRQLGETRLLPFSVDVTLNRKKVADSRPLCRNDAWTYPSASKENDCIRYRKF